MLTKRIRQLDSNNLSLFNKWVKIVVLLVIVYSIKKFPFFLTNEINQHKKELY